MLLALLLAFPDALLQRPYNVPAPWERVSNRCPVPVATTRVVAGSLPPGLRISAKGAVEGVPVEAGDYAFTVEISDGCSRREEPRHIRVTPAPILLAETETLEYQCIQGAPPFAAKIVRVSGSSPGLPYSLDMQYLDNGAASPWLFASMRSGALPANGESLEADMLSMTIDPGKLPAGDYRARLRLSAWQGANAPELHFRLRIDSPLTVLTPIAAPLQPMEPRIPIPEPPSVSSIVPPQPVRPQTAAPNKPKTRPASKPASEPRHLTPARSRILPYPKVVIPKRKTRPAAPATPVHTKPSAMPPHESSAAKHH